MSRQVVTLGVALVGISALIPTPLSAQGRIRVEQGSPMTFVANDSDPGIDPAMNWVAMEFDDSGWADGTHGAGFEEEIIGARGLIQIDVPNGTSSIYTRTIFNVDDVNAVDNLFLGADYDDGFAAWINGVEVYRSDEMPPGPLAWDTPAAGHESSNGPGPDYGELQDISGVGIPLLHTGDNLLAVAVFNSGPLSADLVVVPKLVENAPSVKVTRGPYLQSGSHDRMVVRWRTEHPTKTWLHYGASPTNLDQTVSLSGNRSDHEVLLQNLAADTVYYYAVATQSEILSGGDSFHFFRTAPLPGTQAPVRAWVIGDSGTADGDPGAVRNVFESFNGGIHTDLWLMLGDNAYLLGSEEDYQAAVFDAFPRMLRTTVVWPTFGNHDGESASSLDGTGVYYDAFTLPTAAEAGGMASGTEAYYSFDHGNVHFVVLNGHDVDRLAGGPMVTWLAQDVASTAQDWIIAYWHHPPYSHGVHDSDNPSGDDFELVEMRENSVPILEDAGVDLVLSGHSHSYERSLLLDGHYGYSNELTEEMKLDDGNGRVGGDGAYQKNGQGAAGHEGTVYVVAGNAGFTEVAPLDHPVMVASDLRLGSVVLDVDGDRLDARFLDDFGIVRDEFSLVKNTGAPPVADFSALPLQGSIPFTASFTDLSTTNTADWSWDLDGDDVPDSTLRNPTKTYEVAGTYDVRLVASNQSGSDEMQRTAYVCASDGPPGVVGALVMHGDDSIAWNGTPGVLSWDVIRGDAIALLAAGGDFPASSPTCLADAVQTTETPDAEMPGPGGGFYYLVRGTSCVGEVGSFDGGGTGQAAPRDASLPAAICGATRR